MLNKKNANSIGIVVFITIISQGIALIRESIFAFYYGANMETDAYVIASQLPITLFAIVSSAINTVVLPLYISKKENEGISEADSFLKSFIFFFVCLSFVFILAGEIFVESIVKIFVPYFSDDKLEITVLYSRILFPTVLFSGIINILTAGYNAENKFLYPILAALSQNIILIMSMILFSGASGAIAAVWGTVVGIFLNMILVVFGRLRIFKAKMQVKKMAYDIKILLYRAIPIMFGVGAAEINRIIDKAIASGLDSGSITALNYSTKLTVVLASLILSAVTTISFKEFTCDYVNGNYERRSSSLNQYISLLLAFLIPITIGAIFLKKEVILIVFGRGGFDAEAIKKTTEVFMYSVLGIAFIAIREILSKYFFSAGETRIPLINSGIAVGINIILNFILSKYMGASGLALATTISSVSVCALLFGSAKKKEKELNFYVLYKNTTYIFLASLIMYIALVVLKHSQVFVSVYTTFFAHVFLGGVTYIISLWIFSKDTVKSLLKMFFYTD